MRKFASTKQKWFSGLNVYSSNNWGLLAFGLCLIKAKKQNCECDHVTCCCNYETGINVEMMLWLNYHCCCWIKQFHILKLLAYLVDCKL